MNFNQVLSGDSDTVLGALPFDVERFGDIMAPISDKPLMDDHLKLTAEIFQFQDHRPLAPSIRPRYPHQ